MTSIETVTKSVISRGWAEIEPKVLAFLATGVTASVVIEVGSKLGFHVNSGLGSVIAVVVAAIAGYVKKSTVKGDLTSTAPVAPVDPADVGDAVIPPDPTVVAPVVAPAEVPAA